MNIFVLSKDPWEAAEMQCDKHVVKMPLETAQMLSTAHHVIGTGIDKDKIYGKTHVDHPCSEWVRGNSANYKWALEHFKALLNEFEKRYGKKHSCEDLLPYLSELPDFSEESVVEEISSFALALPEKYESEDAVEAYRSYYKGEKCDFAEWKKIDNRPGWFE